jgi:hypothetical protein
MMNLSDADFERRLRLREAIYEWLMLDAGTATQMAMNREKIDQLIERAVPAKDKS